MAPNETAYPSECLWQSFIGNDFSIERVQRHFYANDLLNAKNGKNVSKKLGITKAYFFILNDTGDLQFLDAKCHGDLARYTHIMNSV